MRVIKSGVLDVVSRHLDPRSSILLKYYLALIRPWVIILCGRKCESLIATMKAGSLSVAQVEREQEKMKKAEQSRNELLLMSKSRADHACAIISRGLLCILRLNDRLRCRCHNSVSYLSTKDSCPCEISPYGKF